MAIYNFSQIKATSQRDKDGLKYSIYMHNVVLMCWQDMYRAIRQTKTPPLMLNNKHMKQNIQNNFKERAKLMWTKNPRDNYTANSWTKLQMTFSGSMT